jgi:hypothetical protein
VPFRAGGSDFFGIFNRFIHANPGADIPVSGVKKRFFGVKKRFFGAFPGLFPAAEGVIGPLYVQDCARDVLIHEPVFE